MYNTKTSNINNLGINNIKMNNTSTTGRSNGFSSSRSLSPKNL